MGVGPHDIARLLEGCGLRVTPQRHAVVEHLERARTHPSAEEILAAINRRFPRASKATVYNTLNALVAAGAVRTLYVEDGVARYDLNVGRHHHFVCDECGRIEDLPFDAFGRLPVARSLGGRRVDRFDLTLHGRCADCR
jgi:Fe2+ or Zn2+ uptake regulation protein